MKSRGGLSIALLSLVLTAPAFCGESTSRALRMTPRFVDVPVEALAEAIGVATGKTFVIQPGLHISLTMTSDRSLSGDELYAEFQRVLDRNGLDTLQRGSYIRIVRKSRPIKA